VFGAGFVLFEDHERGTSGAQSVGQRFTDAAEPANDDVIVELVDLRVHAPVTEDLVKLTERDELHQRASDEDHAGAAEHDRSDGDASEQRGLDRVHLAVADGVDGHDNHVDGVAEAPACEAVVSDGGDHHDREGEADAEDEVT